VARSRSALNPARWTRALAWHDAIRRTISAGSVFCAMNGRQLRRAYLSSDGRILSKHSVPPATEQRRPLPKRDEPIPLEN
jgi:hypothetical protein